MAIKLSYFTITEVMNVIYTYIRFQWQLRFCVLALSTLAY